MKIILVYPPQGDPSQPYLSLPALKGFLRQHGYDAVEVFDLNIEAYDHFTSPAVLSELAGRLRETYRHDLSAGEGNTVVSGRLQTVASALSLAPYVIRNIDEAKAVFRDARAFYDRKRYLHASYVLQRALEVASAAYYPSRFTTYAYFMENSTESLRELLEATAQEDRNMFTGFLEHKADELLAADPGFIGISVTYDSQLVAALTLARIIKRARPDVHICLGGGYISNLHESIESNPAFFEYVDSCVVHEGETALLNLLRKLERKEHQCDTLSNIILFDRERGMIRRGRRRHIEDLAALPEPDFDGMPMGKYLAPAPVLMLDIERGCYWGRCSFCSYGVGIGPCSDYRIRDASVVADILERYVSRYGAHQVVFSTDAAAPAHLERIADKIIERGIDVRWHCTSRVENSFTEERIQKLKRGGCRHIIFGVESGNQRVLDAMDKGVTLASIKTVFTRLRRAGITHKSMYIVGFPGEEWDEAMDTLDFILANRDIHTFVSLEPFSFLKGSKVDLDPSAFFITRRWQTAGRDMSFVYEYETSRGMDRETIMRAYHTMWARLSEVFHGRSYPFVESGASVHTLLYSDAFGWNQRHDNPWLDNEYRDYPRAKLLALRASLAEGLEMVKRPASVYEGARTEGRIDRITAPAIGAGEITALYNPNTDTLALLDETGKRIIDLFNEGKSVHEVVDDFPPPLSARILTLIRYMLVTGLLAVTDVTGQLSGPMLAAGVVMVEG